MNEEQVEKRDGFKGERMIVLPIEAFQEYVTHPLVKRLYLTDVGYFPKAEHHYRIRKDGIDEYILIYCEEGKGTICVEGREYKIERNEAFCIPRLKGHWYRSDEKDPWSILWVHFKGEDVKYYHVDTLKIVKFNSDNAGNRMMYLFEFLFRVLEANYTLGNFIYISQVLSLILAEIYTREKHNWTQEQNKHVTSVIRYMSRHIDENLTLDEIAEEFDLSKSYLNSIFQKYTQHSPVDFFINLKMKKACKLLRSTDLYIYQIAQSIGYSDPYYFSRIFKKVVGMSPKIYKGSDYVHF